MLLGGPNGANWVDGTSKTLTITGLILCPREPEDAGKTYLEGEWSFSLDSFYQGKEVEINTIGAVRWDEETERMVTLEGLTLSPWRPPIPSPTQWRKAGSLSISNWNWSTRTGPP
ncbi:MAG: hypothetical protein ACLRNQ_02255 [Flavonifractor plautii]